LPYGYRNHVIAEAAPLGQPPGIVPLPYPLDRACEGVAAKDALVGKSGIVGIRRKIFTAAGEPGRACRQIDLDHVGNEYPHEVMRFVVGATLVPPKVMALMSPASSGVLAYFWKSAASLDGLVLL